MSKIRRFTHLPIESQIAKIATAFLILTILISATIFATTAQEAQLVATYVNGNLYVDGSTPGQQAFWSQIKEQTVTLKPSNAFGGKTSSVTIKLANNGSWLSFLAKWTDATENRVQMSAVKGQQAGQYVTNSTYKYGDLLFVIFWMGNGAPTKDPYANSQESTRGKAAGWAASETENIWNWRSYFGDQGSPQYPSLALWPSMEPEKYSFGPNKGQLIVQPYSWAWNLHMNSTGNYIIDNGLFHSRTCVNLGNPFTIHARGVWSSGTWTVEMASRFTQDPSVQQHTMSFETGKNYYVAFATADGESGEIMETNSISPWATMTIEAQPPPPAFDYTLVSVVAIVAIVAVVALGLFLRKRSKSAKPAASK